MVEQSCAGEQDRGRTLLSAVNSIHEHSCVDMSAVVRFREPLVGGIGVLLNAFPHEVQLSKQILCVGISVVYGLPQIFRRSMPCR